MKVRPLVALHGFMGSPSTFNALAQHWDGNFVALPLPKPSSPNNASAALTLSSAHEQAAREILADLATKDIQEFDLLGYSLGGRIAIHLARLFPERVHRLVLEAAHPGLDSESERDARREHDRHWAERIRRDGPGMLGEWYEQSVFASLSASLREELIQEKSRQSWSSIPRVLDSFSLGRQAPHWDALTERSRPTLFISGQMDLRYSQVGDRLETQSRQIRHISVPRAGHVVHREQPEAYLGALQSFLIQESSPNT
jgi:2-succinyl-6-hydroxy-2,4-cyclohexadiene-1-carboxylate synthase